MATQTRTQRQAAAQKAAATRKRNAAKQSASSTRTSARRTRASASQTTREAQRTGRAAGRTAARRLDAVTERFEEFGRRAQRVFYIQVGAAMTARDALTHTVRVYANPGSVAKELDKYERRGARALKRGQRNVNREANGIRRDAGDVLERIKRLA
jgi:5-deoxy-D-glucuronate isomerase